jgi:mono/diheme cytochrome c family protein
MRSLLSLSAVVVFLLTSLTIGAQQPPAGGRGGRGGGGAAPPAQAAADAAAVDRGERLLVAECGFCHGANARGGSGGPDLLRATVVLNDENGKELGEFLKVGRPDKGMPKFDLSQAQVADLAAFLHARIETAVNRGAYKILDILTGDPKAGEAYFNGAGGCSACHSPTGDLKGIGSKYDPVALQGRIVMPPRGRGGPGRGGPTEPGKGAITVTVTPLNGAPVTGLLVRLTDFDVTLRDASGQTQSWLRLRDDVPKVMITDPLKAHLDMVTRWTDQDMHNMTAYLATLK